jgi:carboxyl-terminal processing protease
MKTRHHVFALLCTVVSGCASFDPYNIIGRRQASQPTEQYGAPAVDKNEDDVRRETVDYVWRTISERYYRADLNGVDWVAARARWEPQIVAAKTDTEYWRLLDRMTAELGDSHTRVESPLQVEARRNQRVRSLGLSVREIEGQLIVAAVNADSDAFFAGVRSGMRMVEIDRRPAIDTWRTWVANARRSSSPQATRQGAMRALTELARSRESGESGVPGVPIAVLRADGSRIDTMIALRDVSTRPSVTSRTLPSGVGYVRLTEFSEWLRRDLLAAINALKHTPALILDLRGNRGGSAAMANTLIGAFFREPTVVGKAVTRTGAPVTLAFGLVQAIPLERRIPGRGDAYTGKVLVLVDEFSASASEAVASGLQSTRRATIVGQTTCGCLLAFLGYAQLNRGAELAYSEVGYLNNNGQFIEGKGVEPDISIDVSVDDFRLLRDRALEQAVEIALGATSRG